MNIRDQLQRVTVILEPNFDTMAAVEGDLVIGLGDRSKQSTINGCILNHKGSHGNYGCVSDYVRNAPNDIWEAWRTRIAQNGIQRIVIEDLSLDTCFSLVLFLAHLGNANLPICKEESWVTYVSNWEQGRYMDSGRSPRESVACTSSLLGHSYLHALDSKVGLIACCEFLWDLFAKFDTPYAVSFDPVDLHYRRALGRYAYEAGQFQLIVQNSPHFQLLVPVQKGEEKVLTDVIILEESTPSAIVKILLRTDQEYSWSRRGFGMMAVHRPSEAGTGNDVTISVDPDTFLTLEALWLALEKLESERWDGLRPNDNPRRLASHAKFQVPAVNQPWYDGGDLTLIGAPKKVKVDGEEHSGSKLGWKEDILPLLWRLYSPIPREYVTVEDKSEKTDKKVFLVIWKPGKSPTVAENPTLLAWLASLSMEKGEVTSPLDLPHASSFEVLRVAGGMAIVHHQGVTFFDDWSSTPLAIEELQKKTVKKIQKQLADYKSLIAVQSTGPENSAGPQKPDPFTEIDAGAQKVLASESLELKTVRILRANVVEGKKKLLTNLSVSLEPESYDQSRLRETLERFWAVSDFRAEAHEKLERIQGSIDDITTHKKEKWDRPIKAAMAGVGFGLLAKAILDPIRDKYTMNLYEWQIQMYKKGASIDELERIASNVSDWETITLCVFGSCFLLGAVIYWLWERNVTGGGD